LWSLSLAVVLLSACADEPTAPVLKSQKSLSLSTSTQRHLVALKGNGVTPDFEARVVALGGTVEEKLAEIGGAVVSGLSETAVSQLRKHNDVFAIDAEELIPFHTRSSTPMAIDADVASVTQPNTAILYGLQWNLPAISAPKAWAAGKLGSAAVKVAILDTGLDTRSPDASGLIDAASRSFVAADDFWVDSLFPGRPMISDLNGHGTNVASHVSSTAWGFAGVTSRTRLLGVKVCSHALEGCPTGAVLNGVLYAVAQNADVINMSLGGAFLKLGGGATVSLLNRVFQIAEQRGVTVVVASGNSGLNMDRIPAAHFTYCDQTHVICVSATGTTATNAAGAPLNSVDQFSLFSNYSRSRIDVAAPGGNYAVNDKGELVSAGWIYSICSSSSADLVKDEDEKVIGLTKGFCSGPGVYLAGQLGTSQASPHVAGLAALLVAEHGRNPALIRDIIRNSADDLGQAGTDPYIGRGRINVARALGL
jgi:subtilisin family serine protease